MHDMFKTVRLVKKCPSDWCLITCIDWAITGGQACEKQFQNHLPLCPSCILRRHSNDEETAQVDN